MVQAFAQSRAAVTQRQRVLRLTRRKGVLRPGDLEAIGVPRIVLSRMTASGELVRVGRGLYRMPDAAVSEFDSLASIALKSRDAVFCLLTALQIHGLTTQLPREVWIALPLGGKAPRVDYPPLRVVQAGSPVYAAGVRVLKRDHAELKVYDVEKTIADCFKHRAKIGLDVALEALKEARASRDFSADALWRYAKICRVTNVIRPYLEALQ